MTLHGRKHFAMKTPKPTVEQIAFALKQAEIGAKESRCAASGDLGFYLGFQGKLRRPTERHIYDIKNNGYLDNRGAVLFGRIPSGYGFIFYD
jgi:hypothetical protein